jgi:HD-GYP domain-containing protein (c-di-GMP phosphodiesterase class II)
VGDAIPLEARILAVIDAYDAMTSARPYRPPLSHEAAAAELRKHSGTQFDPQCVEAFLALVGKVPEPPQPAEAPAAETA